MTGQRLFAADPSAARSVSSRAMAIRFAFGALLSVIAGVVGLTAGPLLGGAFLAFPAILPATLSLIEHEDGERSARDDDEGALLGSVALVGFAVVASQLLPSGAPLALLAATVTWLGIALVLYVASRHPAVRRVAALSSVRARRAGRRPARRAASRR